MSTVGPINVILSVKTSQFVKNMDVAANKVNTFGKTLSVAGYQLMRFGGLLSAGITFPVVLMAKKAIKSFADFDEAMVQTKSRADNMSESMKKRMGEVAKTVAEDLGVSATGIAKTYAELTQAGMPVEEQMKAMGSFVKFAKVAGMDTTKASEQVYDIYRALNGETEDVAQNQANLAYVMNLVTRAQLISSASVEQMADAMQNKGATAAQAFGYSAKELAGWLATVDSNLKGTAAGESFSIMTRQMDKAWQNNKKIWEELGIYLYKGGKKVPLLTVFNQIAEAMRGLSDEEQSRFITKTLGVDMKSMMPIALTAQKVNILAEKLTKLNDVAGEVDKRMEELKKSFLFKWEQVTAIWENVKTELGEIFEQDLRKIVDKIQESVKWWRSLSNELKRHYAIYALILAAIGPVVTALGILMFSIGAIVSSIAEWGKILLYPIRGLILLTGWLFKSTAASIANAAANAKKAAASTAASTAAKSNAAATSTATAATEASTVANNINRAAFFNSTLAIEGATVAELEYAAAVRARIAAQTTILGHPKLLTGPATSTAMTPSVNWGAGKGIPPKQLGYSGGPQTTLYGSVSKGMGESARKGAKIIDAEFKLVGQSFGTKLKGVFTGLGVFLATGSSKIFGGLFTALKWVGGVIFGWPGLIAAAIAAVFLGILSLIALSKNGIKGIAGLFANFGENIKITLQFILQNFFQILWAGIKDLLTFPMVLARNLFTMIDKVGAAVSIFAIWSYEQLRDNWYKWITDAMSYLWDSLKRVAKDMVSPFADAWKVIKGEMTFHDWWQEHAAQKNPFTELGKVGQTYNSDMSLSERMGTIDWKSGWENPYKNSMKVWEGLGDKLNLTLKKGVEEGLPPGTLSKFGSLLPSETMTAPKFGEESAGGKAKSAFVRSKVEHGAYEKGTQAAWAIQNQGAFDPQRKTADNTSGILSENQKQTGLLQQISQKIGKSNFGVADELGEEAA